MAKPKWEVILSPEIILSLAAETWKDTKDQTIQEVKALNTDLTTFKILPMGDKIVLKFFRATANTQERMTIETDPAGLSEGAGKTKPLAQEDLEAWLQLQDQAHIRKIASTFRQDKIFWTISAFPQTSTASSGTGTSGFEGSSAKGLVDAGGDGKKAGADEGWFSRVFTHSTLVSNVRKGGFVMYFILLCSLGGVYIIIERGYELRRKHLMPSEFLEEILTKLPDKTVSDKEHRKLLQQLINYCEEQDTAIARTLKAGLFVFNQGILGTKSAIMSANHHEGGVLAKGLGLLEVFANIAPLLGLLGTVLGMIKAFEMIAMAGTGRAEVVAAGISEALITTAGGLLVGIPLLVAFHFLEGKIEALLMDIEEFCMDVTERLIRIKEED